MCMYHLNKHYGVETSFLTQNLPSFRSIHGKVTWLVTETFGRVWGYSAVTVVFFVTGVRKSRPDSGRAATRAAWQHQSPKTTSVRTSRENRTHDRTTDVCCSVSHTDRRRTGRVHLEDQGQRGCRQWDQTFSLWILTCSQDRCRWKRIVETATLHSGDLHLMVVMVMVVSAYSWARIRSHAHNWHAKDIYLCTKDKQ